MVLENLLPDIGLYLQLIRFFLVLTAGVFLTRLVLMPASRRMVGARKGDKVSVNSVGNLVGVFGLILSFIVALQAAGFGGLVTVLGAITAALTVAVGFGMRDQVSNIVGGFFIYTDNPFVVGDYIEVNDQGGVVEDVSLRQTELNGMEGEKLVIPNSILTLNPVKNFTEDTRTKGSISLETLPEKAPELEKKSVEIAQENASVLEKPEPEVVLRGFKEGKVEMQLHYWIRGSEDSGRVRSQLLRDLASEADLIHQDKE